MLNSRVKTVEIPEVDGDGVRKSTIERIEEITLQIIAEIHSKNFPKITYCDCPSDGSNSGTQKPPENLATASNSRATTSFDSSRSLSWVFADGDDLEGEIDSNTDEDHPGDPQVEEEPEEEAQDSSKLAGSWRTVDFRRQKSRKNLALIMTVMSHVHKMLINRTTRTRRSLYYELQSEPTADLVKNQRSLDDAVNHVASLLERAPWELGFTATSKGLVCGDLSLNFSGQDFLNCNVPGGVLIPQNINLVTSVRSAAKYVLVVEKDAVFQKLLEEDSQNYLDCILVTGKGYPDLNTRMLVSLLGNKLNIPVYVLVDADPFGIEIMCIYRFGSSLRSREQEVLSCPTVRWVGIHPSEYSGLGISPKNLTSADKARLESLKNRSYIDERLSNELKIMSKKGKVEIEAVSNLSHKFLTAVYLPRKINAREFV